jgi:hypothetical protein
MGKRCNPYCDICPNVKEDLIHILMECARNVSDRADLVNDIGCNKEDLFFCDT